MILLDTSVLIEILRKNSDVIERITNLSNIPLFTSQISAMELIYGITSNRYYFNRNIKKNSRLNNITELLSKFTVLDFDRKAAFKTAEILGRLKLNGNLIDFRDGMIIGIGLSNGINTFYTLNKSHFKRVKEIILL